MKELFKNHTRASVFLPETLKSILPHYISGGRGIAQLNLHHASNSNAMKIIVFELVTGDSLL